MPKRNELHVSISKQVCGTYVINAMHNGAASARSIFPSGTDNDVIMLRTWDEPDTSSSDNARYCALSAHDLWIIARIKRAGTKKRVTELAIELAGFTDRHW